MVRLRSPVCFQTFRCAGKANNAGTEVETMTEGAESAGYDAHKSTSGEEPPVPDSKYCEFIIISILSPAPLIRTNIVAARRDATKGASPWLRSGHGGAEVGKVEIKSQLG